MRKSISLFLILTLSFSSVVLNVHAEGDDDNANEAVANTDSISTELLNTPSPDASDASTTENLGTNDLIDNSQTGNTVEQNYENTELTLQQVVDNAIKNGEQKIILNKSYDSGFSIRNQDVTDILNLEIDLNGNEIKGEAFEGSGECIRIERGNVNLVLKNGNIQNINDSKYSEGIYVYTIKDESKGNVTVTLEGINLKTRTQSIGVQGNNTNQNFNIINSTIECTDEGAIYWPTKTGVLNIQNSRVKGTTGITIKGGSLNVSGDSIIEGFGPYTEPDKPYDGTPGGEFSKTGAGIYLEGGYNDRNIEVVVNSGTISSSNSLALDMKFANDVTNPNNPIRDIDVNGGKFSSNVTQYVVDGKASVSVDGEYFVGTQNDITNKVMAATKSVEVFKGITDLNNVPNGVNVSNKSGNDITVNGNVLTTSSKSVVVNSYDELLDAVNDNTVGIIEISANFNLENIIEVNRDLVVLGNNHELTATYAGGNGNKSMFTSTAGNLSIKNLKLINSPKYGVQSYGSGTVILDNVNIDNPGFGGVLINGGTATLTSVKVVNTDKPAVELAMGTGITSLPKIDENSTVSGGSGIYIDGEQIYKALGGDNNKDEANNKLDSLVETTKEVAKNNNVSLTVKKVDGSTDEVVKPVQPSQSENSQKEDNKPVATWDDGGPFTTDACGNVFDRWGNEIYHALVCVNNNAAAGNTYTFVNTSDR